jgi:hypothetical protein
MSRKINLLPSFKKGIYCFFGDKIEAKINYTGCQSGALAG